MRVRSKSSLEQVSPRAHRWTQRLDEVIADIGWWLHHGILSELKSLIWTDRKVHVEWRQFYNIGKPSSRDHYSVLNYTTLYCILQYRVFTSSHVGLVQTGQAYPFGYLVRASYWKKKKRKKEKKQHIYTWSSWATCSTVRRVFYHPPSSQCIAALFLGWLPLDSDRWLSGCLWGRSVLRVHCRMISVMLQLLMSSCFDSRMFIPTTPPPPQKKRGGGIVDLKQ